MFSAKFRSSTAWMYPPTLTVAKQQRLNMRFLRHDDGSAAQETALTVFQVEVARRLGRPKPHGVDNVVSVARNWGVVRERQHHLGRSQVIM